MRLACLRPMGLKRKSPDRIGRTERLPPQPGPRLQAANIRVSKSSFRTVNPRRYLKQEKNPEMGLEPQSLATSGERTRHRVLFPAPSPETSSQPPLTGLVTACACS